MKLSCKQLPPVLWLETVVGLLSAALFVLTIWMPDWIERSFGAAPDAGNGSTEWGLAFSFATIAVVVFVFAGRTWRKHARLAASA